MGELIPLFPLGTPLFPGIVLPLQIFEPRYRRLVAELSALPADSPRRFFGVVAIRQGWEVERVAPAAALSDVGCTARLPTVPPTRWTRSTWVPTTSTTRPSASARAPRPCSRGSPRTPGRSPTWSPPPRC